MPPYQSQWNNHSPNIYFSWAEGATAWHKECQEESGLPLRSLPNGPAAVGHEGWHIQSTLLWLHFLLVTPWKCLPQGHIVHCNVIIISDEKDERGARPLILHVLGLKNCKTEWFTAWELFHVRRSARYNNTIKAFHAPRSHVLPISGNVSLDRAEDKRKMQTDWTKIKKNHPKLCPSPLGVKRGANWWCEAKKGNKHLAALWPLGASVSREQQANNTQLLCMLLLSGFFVPHCQTISHSSSPWAHVAL